MGSDNPKAGAESRTEKKTPRTLGERIGLGCVTGTVPLER